MPPPSSSSKAVTAAVPGSNPGTNPGTSSGTKTRLTLRRCHPSGDGKTVVEGAPAFTVMLNPSEISRSYSIEYNDDQPLGSSASTLRFSQVGTEEVAFALLFDGTGAVPASSPGGDADVTKQIHQLEDVVYQYQGNYHEPARVFLVWGTLAFHGRLKSMSSTYTLFKPNGEPLRANVKLSFVGSIERKEAELLANASSPDLSHLVQVRDGDTLPLLCERIYGDPTYYRAVARFNGLSEFRRLTVGAQLHFPPLE